MVFAGDLNAERSSDVYALLVGAGGLPGGKAVPSWLPLRDAYTDAPPLWGPPLRCSFRTGSLLDFLLVSDRVAVRRTMPASELGPGLGGSAVRRAPSAVIPSDHLPIGAVPSFFGLVPKDTL